MLNTLILEGKEFENSFEFGIGDCIINDNSKLNYYTWVRKTIIELERKKPNSLVVNVLKRFELETEETDNKEYYIELMSTLTALKEIKDKLICEISSM